MFRHKYLITLLNFILICLISLQTIGCVERNTKAKHVTQQSKPTKPPITYRIADGRILIKPRLKYELAISMHVLMDAEDHHKLFIPWANRMRKSLSKKTYQDAIRHQNTWQLCSLLQEYDGPDEIEAIAQYIAQDKTVLSKCRTYGFMIPKPGVKAQDYPQWYADFLLRYYCEGFGKEWENEHCILVQEDARKLSKELQSLDFSPTTFLEDITGRKFKGSTTIILYPSSFSRPQHAFGFSEAGNKAVVYKVKTGFKGALSSIFHELLHPLIRDCWKAERLSTSINKLATNDAFKKSWEKGGKGSYGFPHGWVDELFVHAIARYIMYKADMLPKEAVRPFYSCDYRSAIYDAIFDKYDDFPLVDDFIYYALTHIRYQEDGNNSKFVYLAGDN